jgi:hypothetical protein
VLCFIRPWNLVREVLTTARGTRITVASREQAAAAIADAEQQLAAAKQHRAEKEQVRKKTQEEQAALIDSKTAMKLLNAGATKSAQGLALLIGLLRERLEELQTLPKLEKEARKRWRKTRRAEKATVRITLMLRSLRNRHDEAIEFGEISSESDGDDDLLYDDDFDLVGLLGIDMPAQAPRARPALFPVLSWPSA